MIDYPVDLNEVFSLGGIFIGKKRIMVKGPTGSKPLFVNLNFTVEMVKQVIENLDHIEVERQQLIFHNVHLKDEETLADYGIYEIIVVLNSQEIDDDDEVLLVVEEKKEMITHPHRWDKLTSSRVFVYIGNDTIHIHLSLHCSNLKTILNRSSCNDKWMCVFIFLISYLFSIVNSSMYQHITGKVLSPSPIRKELYQKKEQPPKVNGATVVITATADHNEEEPEKQENHQVREISMDSEEIRSRESFRLISSLVFY